MCTRSRRVVIVIQLITINSCLSYGLQLEKKTVPADSMLLLASCQNRITLRHNKACFWEENRCGDNPPQHLGWLKMRRQSDVGIQSVAYVSRIAISSIFLQVSLWGWAGGVYFSHDDLCPCLPCHRFLGLVPSRTRLRYHCGPSSRPCRGTRRALWRRARTCPDHESGSVWSQLSPGPQH